MLRSRCPARTAGVAAQARYQAYKPQLRNDFNHRCGYCYDWDALCGGQRVFHVDHFAPKSRFPHLRLEYSNLVYSCAFCNVAKGKKWVGSGPDPSHDGKRGFIDPCLDAYGDHVSRDDTGRLVALTPLGQYIVRHLRLFLERHRLLWNLERLAQLQQRGRDLLDSMDKESAGRVQLLETLVELAREYQHYMGELDADGA